MRLVIDTLIALMAVGLLGGILWMQGQNRRDEAAVDKVRDAIIELQTVAQYHGALGHLSNSPAGFPVHMMPEWFAGEKPTNALLDGEHPWIDLAPPGDRAAHPPDPVAKDPSQAGFWYNPNLGVFRARVPAGDSPQSSLDRYNRVNASDLAEFPQPDDARSPQSYRPADGPIASASGHFNATGVAGKPDADADDILVIEWTSGDPSQGPATIHELPDRWTLPEPPREHDDAANQAEPGDAEDADPSNSPRDDAGNASPRDRRPRLGDLFKSSASGS